MNTDDIDDFDDPLIQEKDDMLVPLADGCRHALRAIQTLPPRHRAAIYEAMSLRGVLKTSEFISSPNGVRPMALHRALKRLRAVPLMTEPNLSVN